MEDAVKAKEMVQQMADLGFWFYLMTLVLIL